jgi:hypothetical protein
MIGEVIAFRDGCERAATKPGFCCGRIVSMPIEFESEIWLEN